MKHLNERLAIAGLLLFCAATAFAADAQQNFDLKDSAPTGSMLKRSAVTGDLPYDKRYDQLTPAQRDIVKSNYEPMAPDDEPPFPAEGRGPIMKALHKAADALDPRGLLDIAVEIGPDGVARSAKIYHAPDDAKFTQIATQILMVSAWKPAVCGGQPCTMWYPMRIDFVAR